MALTATWTRVGIGRHRCAIAVIIFYGGIENGCVAARRGLMLELQQEAGTGGEVAF
jgi:hypothetical protein